MMFVVRLADHDFYLILKDSGQDSFGFGSVPTDTDHYHHINHNNSYRYHNISIIINPSRP